MQIVVDRYFGGRGGRQLFSVGDSIDTPPRPLAAWYSTSGCPLLHGSEAIGEWMRCTSTQDPPVTARRAGPLRFRPGLRRQGVPSPTVTSRP